MIVFGLSGSLRRGSYNRALLRAAASALPPGVRLAPLDDLGAVPPYNQDNEQDPPDAVRRLWQAIRVADAVLIATPSSTARSLGSSRTRSTGRRAHSPTALSRKPAAVIGASTGLFGAVWAQAETRKVLNRIGARVVEDGLTVGQADEAFDEHGNLRSAELSRKLNTVIEALLHEAAYPAKRAA